MIYLYCGQNTFLLEEKLRVFKARYAVKFSHSHNVHNINLSDDGLLNLKELIEARSLFDETVLVFVSGLDTVRTEDVLEILREHKAPQRDDIVVVLYDSVSIKELNKDVREFFENEGTLREFEPLKGARLIRWIEHYVKKGGSSISGENAQLLILRRGDDMLSLSHEIEKLSAYSMGSEITSDVIENLIPANYETDTFRTVDFLARRNSTKALSLLWEHKIKGDDPFQILAMFAYQVRTLLIIKDTEVNGGKSSLHPYVVQKNRPLSKAFEMDELIRLHALVADSDLAIKTGDVEPYTALEDLILEFSSL